MYKANYILANHALTPDEKFKLHNVCPECGTHMTLYQTGEDENNIIGHYICANGHEGLWRKPKLKEVKCIA